MPSRWRAAAVETTKKSAPQCDTLLTTLQNLATGDFTKMKDSLVASFEATQKLLLGFVDSVKKIGLALRKLPLRGKLSSLPARLPAFVAGFKKEVKPVLTELSTILNAGATSFKLLPLVGTQTADALTKAKGVVDVIVSGLSQVPVKTSTTLQSMLKMLKKYILESRLVKGYFSEARTWLEGSIPDPQFLDEELLGLTGIGGVVNMANSERASSESEAVAAEVVLLEVDASGSFREEEKTRSTNFARAQNDRSYKMSKSTGLHAAPHGFISLGEGKLHHHGGRRTHHGHTHGHTLMHHGRSGIRRVHVNIAGAASENETASVDTVDPCVDSPSLQCVGAAAMRFPMEAIELFNAAKRLDFGQCIMDASGEFSTTLGAKVLAGVKASPVFISLKNKGAAIVDDAKKLVLAAVSGLGAVLSEGVRTLGGLRDLITGLPERLRLALLRMEPTAASMKAELLKMMHALISEAKELVTKAVVVATRTAKGLYFAFGGIIDSAVEMADEAASAATDFANTLPSKGAQMLVVIKQVLIAVKDNMVADTSPCGAFMRQVKSAYRSFQTMKAVAPVMFEETKALVFTFVDAAKLVGGALANLPKGTSATQLVGYAKGVISAGKVAREKVGTGLKITGERLRALNTTCVKLMYPLNITTGEHEPPEGEEIMDSTCYKFAINTGSLLSGVGARLLGEPSKVRVQNPALSKLVTSVQTTIMPLYKAAPGVFAAVTTTFGALKVAAQTAGAAVVAIRKMDLSEPVNEQPASKIKTDPKEYCAGKGACKNQKTKTTCKAKKAEKCRWTLEKAATKLSFKYIWEVVIPAVVPVVCDILRGASESVQGLSDGFIGLSDTLIEHMPATADLANKVGMMGGKLGEAAMPMSIVAGLCDKLDGSGILGSDPVKLVISTANRAKEALLNSDTVTNFFSSASSALDEAIPDPTLLTGAVGRLADSAGDSILDFETPLDGGSEGLFVEVRSSTHLQLQVGVAARVTNRKGPFDNCGGEVNFQCMAQEMLRIPGELAAVFEVLRTVDFVQCLPFTSADEHKLVALMDSVDGAKKDAVATGKRLVGAFRTGVRSAVASLNEGLLAVGDQLSALRGMVIELPVRFHAFLKTLAVEDFYWKTDASKTTKPANWTPPATAKMEAFLSTMEMEVRDAFSTIKTVTMDVFRDLRGMLASGRAEVTGAAALAKKHVQNFGKIMKAIMTRISTLSFEEVRASTV